MTTVNTTSTAKPLWNRGTNHCICIFRFAVEIDIGLRQVSKLPPSIVVVIAKAAAAISTSILCLFRVAELCHFSAWITAGLYLASASPVLWLMSWQTTSRASGKRGMFHNNGCCLLWICCWVNLSQHSWKENSLPEAETVAEDRDDDVVRSFHNLGLFSFPLDIAILAMAWAVPHVAITLSL